MRLASWQRNPFEARRTDSAVYNVTESENADLLNRLSRLSAEDRQRIARLLDGQPQPVVRDYLGVAGCRPMVTPSPPGRAGSRRWRGGA